VVDAPLELVLLLLPSQHAIHGSSNHLEHLQEQQQQGSRRWVFE
jgi:hypothetical protein